jgi:hypothetical protein
MENEIHNIVRLLVLRMYIITCDFHTFGFSLAFCGPHVQGLVCLTNDNVASGDTKANGGEKAVAGGG